MKIKVKTRDIIMISRIAKKTNIIQDMQQAFKDKEGAGEEDEVFGLGVFSAVVENIHLAEDEIYELLSSVTGYKLEEVKDMEVTELMDTFSELINNQAVKDFFSDSVASQ